MIPKGFFLEYIILIPCIAWVIAYIFKVIFRLLKPNFDKQFLLSSGDLPSVHTCFMASLTTAILIREGFNSSIFALSLAMCSIVIYDAMNVRLETERHAEILNSANIEINNDNLKKYFPLSTQIGHTPIEVFIGGILGIIIGFCLSII